MKFVFFIKMKHLNGMKLKGLYTLIFSVFVAVCAFGQTVTDVDAYQEGQNIIITYQIDKAGSVGDVFCSTDGGRTWGNPLKQVSGDVNKAVKAGKHRITWNVLAEGYDLKGSNICFKVEEKMVNVITIKVKGVTFEMVRVEGGVFTMGTDRNADPVASVNESPMHSVTLDCYYMGKTEVTQALWQAVMGNNPSNFKGSNLPVENVSWDDCQAFISKLNVLTKRKFRLPTEAEWEYAARGGNKSRGYLYAGSDSIDDVAWYDVNGEEITHPVASKQPNELGLYDMSGNVYEWCTDWYARYTGEPQTNPQGPTTGSGRIIRGGSIDDLRDACRSTSRDNDDFNDRDNDMGLRLAL